MTAVKRASAVSKSSRSMAIRPSVINRSVSGSSAWFQISQMRPVRRFASSGSLVAWSAPKRRSSDAEVLDPAHDSDAEKARKTARKNAFSRIPRV